MGNTSSHDAAIARQEEYVRRRKNDPDIQQLQYGFFKDGHKKYSRRQIEGLLRQEYNKTRSENPDSYVLDSDYKKAQQQVKL